MQFEYFLMLISDFDMCSCFNIYSDFRKSYYWVYLPENMGDENIYGILIITFASVKFLMLQIYFNRSNEVRYDT